MKFFGLSIFSLFIFTNVVAQTVNNTANNNPILTSVPFLNITPDARSGAMGDAGVALSPSVFDTYWNPSKLAFLDEEYHMSLSYTPWMRKIADDVNVAYLNFAKKINDRNAIGASINYFNQGLVYAFDANQVALGTYQPNELAIDVSFARKMGNDFSMALTGKYIYSNIIGTSAAIAGTSGHAGHAFAANVSLYYKKSTQQFGKEGTFSFGTNISNIGTKINYYDGATRYFLPTNLKVGVANQVAIDDKSKFTVTLDVNKLLAPTSALKDANGAVAMNDKDNQSIVSGIFGSFSDAPGGFTEEIKEINYAMGMEYMYDKTFALRAGYFYENPYKGDRRYVTMGAGYRYQNLMLDFSYLVTNQSSNPLNNTFRFTLSCNFGKKRY